MQLIGLSIDSVYAHIAWIRSIEQHFNVKIKFPVIADLDNDWTLSSDEVDRAIAAIEKASA